MSHRSWLTALARLSMLNAIALSLLGIQFLVPLAMIALIVIVPAICALQVRLLPRRVWLLAALSVLMLALLLFGLEMGIWMVLYLFLGTVCGLAQRIGWHRPGRVLLTGLVCVILLCGVVMLFAWLVELDWAKLISSASGFAGNLPLLPLGLAGLFIWAAASGLGVDLVASNVFEKLRATQAGVVTDTVLE